MNGSVRRGSAAPVIEVFSLAHARQIAVRAQGLERHSARRQPMSVASAVERVGCVQLDALQAVRRSHELVLLSRGVSTRDVNLAHDTSAGLFETWGHAHSLLPQRLWPVWSWRRHQIKKHGLTGSQPDLQVIKQVLNRIEESGPSTLNDLGRSSGVGWERSSPAKTACEWLLSIGELAVVNRDAGWRRVYRTPAQAGLPHPDQVDPAEGLRQAVLAALQVLGISTAKHVRDYFRFPRDVNIAALARSCGYDVVRVHGSDEEWFVDRNSLESTTGYTLDPSDVIPLSPFDSLIWTRSRQQFLFGKTYLLEAYKPASRREFGYFSMPLLLGDRIIGRVAARRYEGKLIVENFECDSDIEGDAVRASVEQQLNRWTAGDTP